MGIIKIRYSTELNYRKYVKGYDILSFSRKFGDKYEKKNSWYYNKNRNRCWKICLKKSSSKNAKATGHLIGQKITGKIISAGKSKEDDKTKKVEEIYLSPEKWRQIIDDLKLFYQLKKMEFKKIVMIKIYRDLLPKNGFKFLINQEKITMVTKKLKLKLQC